MADVLAEAVMVTRAYARGSAPALEDVSLAVAPGEIVAVMGPSGSGKSTLLFLLVGLDEPDGGHVRVAGVDWATLVGRTRAEFRRRTCGFIAQGLTLLPQATAAENVEVPLLLDSVDPGDRARRVTAALADVGLAEHAAKLPDQLSGGEQQRVAIARALANEPDVLLADEPTGNLDTTTGEEIVAALRSLNEDGLTVVLVTHDPAIAGAARRVVRLRDGRVVPRD